jgi:predicted dehydrogenase
MLKVAIIGCGKIADSHASQIQRIRGAEIVAVCDREPLMAEQLQARFPIGAHYSDVDAMLDRERPDVVHITTPPSSHFSLARRCLEAGCHVYVEKPFTERASETEMLIEMATARRLSITAGHDDQFTHVARRMRALVRDGYLGGPPVHMESAYCYDLGDTGYARALLGDPNHWVRRLPGKLLHNIISHGIARIAEFMTTESPRVIAYGFVSPTLKNRGEREIVDELRAIITEDERVTAYFTFSSQMRPSLHEFRLFGPRNGLLLDHDHEILLKLPGRRHVSYAEKFVPPVSFARQHLQNLKANVRTFLASDFHMKSGMKHLIESFYRSVTDGTPVPIPYSEILRTARIMDAIFAQLNDPPAPAARQLQETLHA